MLSKPGLSTTVDEFFRTLDSNVLLWGAVAPFCVHNSESMSEHPLHPSQARRIVALAFLGTIDAWELYLEDVFVRYLCGAQSPGGYSPRHRLGIAHSSGHAYQLLTGDQKYARSKQYLSWRDPQDIIDRAEVFFSEGHPFKRPMEDWLDRLRDAIDIRNRVVHSSERSREAFKRVALDHLGLTPNDELKQGYSVGDLLLEPTERGFPGWSSRKPYFQSYMLMFQYLVNQISPL